MRIGGTRTIIVILAAAMAAGLLLRLRQVDEPPIGYHSMKEVHYLSVTRGYLEHGDLARKRVLYSGMSEGPGYIEGLPQFQFLPLIYYPLWKLFGTSLWLPRMVVILFSLGSVLMLYLAARRLTARRDVPLIAAIVMTVLPVSVFFGRNIQPDFAALFFGLLSVWLFLRWIDDTSPRFLVLSALSAAVTVAVKGTFIVMFAPLVAVYPWGELKERRNRRRVARQVAFLLPGAVLVAAWAVFTKSVQTGEGGFFPLERLFLSEAFTISYWQANLPIVWRYIGDNYTYFLFFIFALGMAGCLVELSSDGSNPRLSRYVIGSFLSAVLYFVLISDFAVRHSYYQIPFIPMVCLGIASAVSDGILVVRRRGGRWDRYGFLLPVLLLVAASPFLKKRIDYHFDKQMIGADAAGRYIAGHAGPEDRVFISFGSPSDRRYDAWRTQYYGTLWEAGRRGSLLPADIERVRFGEEEREFRWIVMFRTKWLERDRPLLDHIHRNYSLRQIGYMLQKGEVSERDGGDEIYETDERFEKGKRDDGSEIFDRDDRDIRDESSESNESDKILLYYVLEKGGSFDTGPFRSIGMRFERNYSFSGWTIGLWTKEREE